VVVSGTRIGTPTVEHPDVLVCMNRPSFERFAGDVAPGGTIIVDETVDMSGLSAPSGAKLVVWPAIRLAEEFGVPKAANTMMLAALKKLGLTGLSGDSLEEALVASFKKKPALGEKNRELLRKAESQME
jgi:2-oxoisovalerate ferredoxin oxidoreductase beta subunit